MTKRQERPKKIFFFIEKGKTSFIYLNHFLLVIFILVTLPVKSQKFIFKHLTTQDGLSHASITCILKDNKGYMWFGTEDGLNKYDAYRFSIFKNDLSNNTSISANLIQALACDSNELWVGTINGLNKYSYKSDNFIRYFHNDKVKNSISNNSILSLLKDKKGRVWIGTANGLNLYSRKNNSF